MASRTEERAFPSNVFPRHRRGSRASGSSARRPMPHTGSKGLASAEILVPVLRRWYFMVVFRENAAKLPARTASSRTRSQNRVFEVTHASTNALVRARVWRRHNVLLGGAVLEKASLFRHHKLLRSGIRHVIHDKRRGGPLRKTGWGLPEQHYLVR